VILREVHHFLCISVHQNCSRHGRRRPVLATSRQVTSLPAVVLLLHQVVPGPEGHQVGVVGRGGDGDGPGAPDVGVAQLVGQLLQLVSIEMIIVPENVVVAGSGGSLDTLMGAEIEVKLGGVSDPDVHRGSGWNVSTLPTLLFLV